MISIKTALSPLYDELKQHRLYASISTVENLVVFMNHHVFSVWDFMNLLKTLQAHLTCTTIPWKPVLHPENARLINSIVLEEESDVIEGKTTSHFAFYLEALTALDPSSPANVFFKALASGLSYQDLIKLPSVPAGAKPFLQTTYQLAQGPLVGVASAFTYGREGLIPTMFQALLDQSAVAKNPDLKKFIDYIQRHIELDGDVHSHLAEQMTHNLIHTENDLAIAITAAKTALQARIQLWDAILAAIEA